MRSRGYLRRLVVAVAVVAGLVSFQQPAAADTFSGSGCATERIATLPPFTLVGMAFAPDGRLFVWQKNGIVRVIRNGQMLSTPFIDLERQGQHLRRPRVLGPRVRSAVRKQRPRVHELHLRARGQPQ